jgi:hypothetical protein
MVNFWLNNFESLFALNNFNLNNSPDVKAIKILNILSLFIIVFSILFTLKTKKVFYFGIGIILLSIIILIYNNNYSSKSGFSAVDTRPSGSAVSSTDTKTSVNGNQATTFTNSIQLIEDVLTTNTDTEGKVNPVINKMKVSSVSNINPGDIIQISDTVTASVSETNIIDNVYTGTGKDEASPFITVKNALKKNYLSKQTKIGVVKSVAPQIQTPPDPLLSIQQAKPYYNPASFLFEGNIIKNDLNNRTDARLDRAVGDAYKHQGPPYGDLACRPPTINNPMQSLNVTEFGTKPNMFGSCNINMSEDKINEIHESGVSMRREDLIYHRGNSQQSFYPVAVDTHPNQQELFAMYCYQTPGNLVNPKYASAFVNNPKQFKLLSTLARATGTENGGGGGGFGAGAGGRTS